MSNYVPPTIPSTDTDVLRYSSSRSWSSAAQYIVNHAHLPAFHAHNGSQNGPVALVREKVDHRVSVYGFGKKRSTDDSNCGLKDHLAKDVPSPNGNVSPEKDLSPSRHLALPAKVPQSRPLSPDEGANDVAMSPGSRGRLSLLKLELGRSPTTPSPDAHSRDLEADHTPSEGQGYKDICLEAHLSSHKTPRSKVTPTPSESPLDVEGAPFYVYGCSATASSDRQTPEVLRLKLTVCYDSDSRRSLPRATPSGIRRTSDSIPPASTKTTSVPHIVGETSRLPFPTSTPPALLGTTGPPPRRSSCSDIASAVSASKEND